MEAVYMPECRSDVPDTPSDCNELWWKLREQDKISLAQQGLSWALGRWSRVAVSPP